MQIAPMLPEARLQRHGSLVLGKIARVRMHLKVETQVVRGAAPLLCTNALASPSSSCILLCQHRSWRMVAVEWVLSIAERTFRT
jgi:hypothetical protein